MSQLKCLICGMNINSNTYDLNNYSFVEKNEKGRIINCPFCGVSKIYLDDEKEIYYVEEDLDQESLEVLDHAMKLEVFNGEFYKEASNLAENDEIKKLFKDLSNIEFMHARVHKRLGGFEQLPKLHKPDYHARLNTDKLLLEEAYKREEHAIAFYKKNSTNVCSKLIKEIFKALSDVEKQHEIIANNYI
ncbi:ferritin family protein [Crassaminicella profunda]|uniref:ferritin family protein n=1 Tax=Crassaminicella profunda TaxID=1286698 RepID=UPI001CA62377|nr:ferritin family protein [Crassaminicella profunda]QZY53695.1 metal-iron-binding protein [Crassaminicella profunda]